MVLERRIYPAHMEFHRSIYVWRFLRRVEPVEGTGLGPLDLDTCFHGESDIEENRLYMRSCDVLHDRDGLFPFLLSNSSYPAFLETPSGGKHTERKT